MKYMVLSHGFMECIAYATNNVYVDYNVMFLDWPCYESGYHST